VLKYWEYLQKFLDIDGDAALAIFTGAVIWKILHGGLNMSDAAAYSSAIGAFAVSNIKGPK